jgi:hypothetical protein
MELIQVDLIRLVACFLIVLLYRVLYLILYILNKIQV